MPASVFVSYGHGDMTPTDWLGKLRLYFAPMRRSGSVDIWDDGRIFPGADWRAEIEAALAGARAAILLVGPHFLASEFIDTEELPRLLRQKRSAGLQIYPLIVGYCSYASSPLADLQSVNDPKTPLEALPPAEQNRIINEFCMSVDRELRNAAAVQQPSRATERDLRSAVTALGEQLQQSWTTFVAQCNRRDKLHEKITGRTGFSELQYELFFFDNFDKLTGLERFEFDQIRALTDNLQAANSRSLAVLNENPELFSMLPSAQKLKQHLNFWLNKYDRVFLKTPQMCVLYTGVEDAVPFPAGMDQEIDDWLSTHKGV